MGRPLALATFLIDRHGWPSDPEPFLHFNLLIHLINGLLVAWLAFRLCLARGSPVSSSGYAAALASATWMVLPILASTTLLVVQRMTSLSAMFVLFGLIGYLLSRQDLARRPAPALIGMAASLVGFTLLAVLAKENGALLPVFALVIEATLLSRPRGPSPRTWTIWRGIFLWLPAAAIAAMLASMIPYTDATATVRGFGALERLLAEAVILWEYLFHAFVPSDLMQLGPFQNASHAPRSLGDIPSLIAIGGWIGVMASAWYWRHTAPMFAFAVAWYLSGHLVESTVVPLDLYFEHRNYVPLIGPVIAMAWAVIHIPVRHRAIAGAGAGVYVGLLALSLWVLASQWGQPLREAQKQYAAHPASSRALGHYTAQLLGYGLVKPAAAVMAQAIERGVAPERLQVARLFLRCRHGQDAVAGNDFPRLRKGLENAEFDRNLAHALYVLTDQVATRGCDSLNLAKVEQLVEILAGNPRFRAHGESGYWLERGRMRIAERRGNREALKMHLHRALAQRTDRYILERLVELYAADGEFSAACERLETLREKGTWNPTRHLYRKLVTRSLAADLNKRAGHNVCPI